MSARAGFGRSPNYFSGLFAVVRISLAQLVRPPSHSRRAEAARRSARHALLLTATVGAVIIALMYALDAREIGLMPPTRAILLELADVSSVADVLAVADGRVIAPVLPVLVETAAGWEFRYPRLEGE